MKKQILFGVVAVMATLLTTGAKGPDKFTEFVGKPAPKFEMKTTAGKMLNNKNLKGKVVVLDFWASWCGPCKVASPSMQKLHTDFAKKGLVVIGANAFERGDKDGANAKAYKKEHKYTYTMTYGNDELAKKWGITSIPTFIVIGRDGKVAKTYQGFSEKIAVQMRKDVEKLLASK